ncbi:MULTISPECIES: PucR family transcriptional regulator [Streptomyces]|uniref:PucR C-terminal helix-turn-helix domain-containing protein n=1 Tax=Streptomyces griseoaurantiacus TaxID=68213 RepID=A0A1G7PI70_9ACTN|nr:MULTISPECIES: helix-turn-helix domain-containing protein [Streptomyces]MDX3362778.1 helix-turn-helix domain-containing protein [Streptomyces sp. ME02-6978.2a]WTI26409.1 helix-turn-helix domain-containing protein [Streptomyces jietaisiensis]SDF86082.1 PucR C-terminal helix-turn-helix domain-containing protein [Streptomyces jietaisiensis]
MKGLLLRLSSLDADATAAVRVIAHFQALLAADRVDPAALLRSTAALAECPAGWELADGRVLRAGPDGTALADRPGRMSGAADLGTAGRVWLERPGPPGPFDDLVLEWLAVAARTLAQPSPAADPGLLEVVLSGRETVADRTRALRLLGFAPQAPLRAVVVAAPGEPEALVPALLARGGAPGTVRAARLGGHGVVLLQRARVPGAPPAAGGGDSPAGELREVLRGTARVGVGGAVEALRAAESWQQAVVALRFAVPGVPAEAVADHEELGTAAVLAELPAARLRELPDVALLAAVAAREGGAAGIEALSAFCRTGSLRQAAAELHLHHSSVATRLERVEAATGWRLRDCGDRFRARLALYAWRLAGAEEGEALTTPGRGAAP